MPKTYNEGVFRRQTVVRVPRRDRRLMLNMGKVEPLQILFFLNTLPRQINTRYLILADGIIEADKVIIA